MLTRLSRAQKRIILFSSDAAIFPPAVWIAILLRAETGLLQPDWTVLAAMATCVIGAMILGVANIRISAFEERAAVKSLALSLLVAAAFSGAAALSGHPIAFGLAALIASAHFGLALLIRYAMAATLRWAHAQEDPQRRVLIYGAGTVGLQALRALRSYPGVTPVGFIDDAPSMRGLMIGGVKVHPTQDLARVVDGLNVGEVLIARPDLRPDERTALTDRLAAAGLRIAGLPAFAHLTGPAAAIPSGLIGPHRALPDLSAVSRGCYCGRVVMVTGAGGSIGSELAHQILQLKPARLILVEMNEYALYQLEDVLQPLAEQSGVAVDFVLGSVGDPDLMRCLLQRNDVSVILHAAAYKHVSLVETNPVAALSNNVLGTENIARIAAEQGVSRFVLISTDKAVRPAGAMGWSKWMAEQVLRDMGRRHPAMQIAIVRFGNVLGSSGSVLPRFQDQVQSGGPVTVTDARMERYFMSLEEAVHLVLEAGAMAGGSGEQGETFLFDMGQPMRIEALARNVIRSAGYTVRDADHPDGDIALSFLGARLGEKLSEDLSLGGELRATGHPQIFSTPDPALSEFEVAGLLSRVRHATRVGQPLDLAELAHTLGEAPARASVSL